MGTDLLHPYQPRYQIVKIDHVPGTHFRPIGRGKRSGLALGESGVRVEWARLRAGGRGSGAG